MGPNMQQPCMSNTAGWAWGEWGAGVGAAVHGGESREWTSAVSRSPAGLATSSRRGKAGGVGANATHGPADVGFVAAFRASDFGSVPFPTTKSLGTVSWLKPCRAVVSLSPPSSSTVLRSIN